MSVLDVTRQRSAFTDALRPPPGFVLGACIGTTFSLDFELFTAVLLAFVGADVEEPLNNAPAVLTSVARLKSRLRVFVNGGSLHPPATTNRLFALYDRILRPKALEGGAFHPKVWVLRFDPVARPERHSVEPIYRLLTASRNVTDSGCWELGALFEGTRRAGTQKFGSDVAAFCRKVAASRDLPKALWKLIEELKYVEFVAPREASEGLRFDWQWPGDRVLVNRLPRTISRALLISPFLRADFLKRLCDRTEELTLVSTQDELDQLSDETHERLANARVFVVSAEADEEVPSLELHAKLLAWESEGVSETLIGSANATGPGWGCSPNVNCEAVVSLRPGLGIDAVVKAFVAPAKDQLQPWIERYVRQTAAPDPEREAAKRLEHFVRLLRAVQIRGEYDPAKKSLRLLAPSSAGGQAWPAGMCAEIVPLLQRDQSVRADYRLVYGPGAAFQGIELEDVAAFAYVVVWNEHHRDVELRFVVQFELNLGALEDDERDKAVNARLLEGVDARSLLLDVLAGLPGGTSRSAGGGQFGVWQPGDPLLRRATIEKILEACTADPSRIHEVEAVLAACGDASSMSTFREFWAVFRESLEEEGAGV
ncbi:MAG: phospholipase D family protein [Burkholderiales bacterium]|nr:phospholipase D family protein [Burkholderiales bacterium]